MTREEFLDAFFGDGNMLGRDEIEANPALSELVGDLVDDLARPVVLPRRTSQQDVEWFVMCADDTTFRRLQAEVQAFIGPSYARWDGIRARLDPRDPVERAVDVFAGGRALRFRTASDDEFRDSWAALNLMRAAWRQRPVHDVARVRPGAPRVREFELAVPAGDAATVPQRVAELPAR